MPRRELFLSHATPDRAFVERLTKRIAEKKLRYFYSKHHIAGAQQWHDELGVALARCNWFVLVLSKKSVKSVWVKRELLYALQSSHYQERILPVLLEPCDASKLSWTLRSFQFVDFTHDFEAGFERLLESFAKPLQRKASRAGKSRPRKKAPSRKK